jgi:hypothetical protein
LEINLNTLFILCVIFFSTLVRSIFGFGEALIAMPLLAIIVDLKTATPLVTIIAGTITTTILITSWRRIQFNSVWRLVVSSFAGIPLGLIFLKDTYDVTMKLVLAVVIVAFSVYSLIKPKIGALKTEHASYIFGFVAGILGGAYNTAGPPVVIYGYMRKWSPESFRATLQGYFFPTWIIIILSHGMAGFWTRSMWQLYVISLPLIFLASLIGSRLNKSMTEKNFDRYIHALLVVIGMFLFVRTIWGILPAV